MAAAQTGSITSARSTPPGTEGRAATRPSTPGTHRGLLLALRCTRVHPDDQSRRGPRRLFVVHFSQRPSAWAHWNTVMALGSGAEVFTTQRQLASASAPANAPMHQVLMQLRYLFGIEIPHFKYEKLRDLARHMELVKRHSGAADRAWPSASNVFTPRVRHPYGRHADPPCDPTSFIAARRTWARRSKYVYGKHSGALVIEHALRQGGPSVLRLSSCRSVMTRGQEESAKSVRRRADFFRVSTAVYLRAPENRLRP